MSYKLGMCGPYFHAGAVMGLPREQVELIGITDKRYAKDTVFFNPNIAPRRIVEDMDFPLYDNYVELPDKESRILPATTQRQVLLPDDAVVDTCGFGSVGQRRDARSEDTGSSGGGANRQIKYWLLQA